jgi:hypothetical protein
MLKLPGTKAFFMNSKISPWLGNVFENYRVQNDLSLC